MGKVTQLRQSPPAKPKIAFVRREMDAILDIYGRLVLVGEAKDYAIGMYKDHAVFAVFRRHAETPTWRITKTPALANAQGAFAVLGSENQVLKRGRDLKTVLSVFDRRRFQVISN
ncbi:MAG: DUF2794 domain-containing protein [Pseudomonadota bacterium]